MITSQQIVEKANHFKLKQRDLVLLTNVNTSGVCRIFSKKKPKEPTPIQAAAFYWLFKHLESINYNAESQKVVSLLGGGE